MGRHPTMTPEERLDKAIEMINNCHPTVVDDIKTKVPLDLVGGWTAPNIKKYINKHILNITKTVNRSSPEYWIKRGWSEQESNYKSKENSKVIRENCISPFSREFWTAKGYTEEQADFMRNSRRPIRKEYWIQKGYSEQDAILKAAETKQSNNKKGKAKQSLRSKEQRRQSSRRTVEYWTMRGLSVGEAKERISDIQGTFSLQKCIDKYGELEGSAVWRERQERWQLTMTSKPQQEKDLINSKKRWTSLDNYDSVEDCIRIMRDTHGSVVVSNIDELVDRVKSKLEESPFMVYWPIDKIIDSMPKVQLEIIDPHTIRENIAPLLKSHEIHFIRKTGKQAYRRWEDGGLLRSSYEIYFYDNFIKLHPRSSIKIDNCYPNSNFRYDFMIFGSVYVEVCPMYNKDETYRNKMDHKQKVFGCALLKTVAEIDNFLDNI